MASALAAAARPGRPGCAPWGGVERRRAAACAAVGSPRRPVLGQLHAQHPVSRLSTQQQQQQQQQQKEQQQRQQHQPDAEPQLGAAHQQAQRQPQDGQPQRPDWQLRRVDTLPALLQLAMPQPKRGEAPATLPQEGGPQQQQAAAAGGEQPADEYRGPKLRYGRQVCSLAELEAAVLDHWSTTAGDRIPGTDKHESLALPGLADIAVVSRAGREYDDWKLSNQDCHLLLPLPSTCTLATAASSDEEDPVAAEQQPHAVVLGVFDGHGLMGTAASRYTRQFIATGLLRSQWRHVEGPCEGFGSSGSQDGDMGSLDRSLGAPAEGSAEAAQQLLEAAFECAGAGILNSGLELRESGSTAVVCHVEPGRITTAWCGDSRAVLGLHVDRQEAGPALLVHPLTEDHRPDRPLERARIEAAGGQVVQLAHDAAGNPVGPFRLCGSNLYMAPRPMVSRAFGDTNAVEWGLTHTPDLLSVEFPGAAGAASSTSTSSGMSGSMVASQSATDSSSVPGEAGPRHVLILGSDGFFDTTSMIDACVAALDHSTALEAAQTLADSALRRWAVETQGVRCDDITVVVAFLPA